MSDEQETEQSFEEMEFTRKKAVHAVVSFGLVILVVLLMFASVAVLRMLKKDPEKSEEVQLVPAVNVLEVREADRILTVRTQGVVESVRNVVISAEVGGRVVSVSPNLLKGASVTEGELLVEIEKADYESALKRAEASREDAKLLLAQEEARRDQALRDWKKLGRGEPSELVLRKPHIDAAKARLSSAEEEVERARRDLARTEVRAPFAGVVSQESAELGAVLAPGSMVAQVYSATELEVRLPVSLEDFGALARDEDGNVVGDVTLTGVVGLQKYSWPGKVARTDGQIDSATLSATVIVRVGEEQGNPAYLRFPPVGMFLEARVPGQVLPNVVEIPRMAVRGKDRVLVVDEQGRMTERHVEVLRTLRKTVLVGDGLGTGEALILTRMNGVVDKIKVDVVERFSSLADVIGADDADREEITVKEDVQP